jgi:hypothetical protein
MALAHQVKWSRGWEIRAGSTAEEWPPEGRVRDETDYFRLADYSLRTWHRLRP